MATVDELARDIVGSLAFDEGYLLAATWINNRYKQLVSRVRFKHLRKIGEIQIPAIYNTGTVDTTRDSTAVTGTDTVWTTAPTTTPGQYWYFKGASAWYNIASVASATALTLTTAFSETALDDDGYTIAKRYHPLATTARWLGDFVLSRLRLPLGPPIPLEQLDREAPGRILTSQYPTTVTQIGVDTNGYVMVEFYPYSASSEIVHYVYWDLPTDLTISSTIPPQIDPYVLKEGALIDAYRYAKSKARQKGDHEGANSWRNDEFAQQTVYERRIREAVRTDQGADDKSFILSMYGPGGRTSRDIVTAHDHVYTNWSYPS
jgi:hypothetical protein